MPSVGEMVDRCRVFLVDILPQAAVSVSWTLENAEKAFNWAKYCQDMDDSLAKSGHMQELEEELVRIGEATGKHSVFQRANLRIAPLLLLEEFLRNPDITEESMLWVMKAMSNVFPPEKFQAICSSAVERKSLYESAISLIQSGKDSQTVSVMKALIMKEDLLRDLNPVTLEAKLDPLLKSVQTTELLLTVFSLTCEGRTLPEVRLGQLMIQAIETRARNWLENCAPGVVGGGRPSATISALLAVPVVLSRKVCEMSPDFLRSWLDILGLLASHLIPVYYSQDHVWSWPGDDDDNQGGVGQSSSDSRFRGLWFSLDQLVRHMQSLCTPPPAPSIGFNEDHVTLEARQFLDRQKQLAGLCSIWMEVEQRLSIKTPN
jgi:hypothetical protein